ncbi:hypothetical protein CcarbDRAFT_4841 [Clostridium carboxidivorans P7]|uniref:Uncharacterized protein n=1 Tax=Clostridium carboxidivorans P7 TaxID=536227 RepID=C6Q1C4_9CLOT|nr:hypothetical protein CcarbDRAFT_4841 [Clostridium carboxidivorans P7]
MAREKLTVLLWLLGTLLKGAGIEIEYRTRLSMW